MFCLCFVDHRDLHVLTHSFPTLRSSDLHLDPARAWLAAQYRLEIFLQRLFADLEAGGDVEGVLRLLIFLGIRSEEHTSELQSLMRTSYAVFCLKKKIINKHYAIQSLHSLVTLIIICIYLLNN